MPRYIAGVKIDFELTKDDVLKRIEEIIAADEKAYICTVNAEFIMAANKDPEFKEILNKSAISFADGIGVVLADEYLQALEKLPRNILFPFTAFIYGFYIGLLAVIRPRLFGSKVIKGSQFIYDMCDLAAKRGYTVFFLGGGWGKAGDLATEVSHTMSHRFNNLRVVGASSKFSRLAGDDAATVPFINESMENNVSRRINMLFIAYGHGYQERWAVRNKDNICVNVVIGLGGSFDYVVCGESVFLRMLRLVNMETLYRFITKPRRWRRILIAFPIFPIFIYYLSLCMRLKKQQ